MRDRGVQTRAKLDLYWDDLRSQYLPIAPPHTIWRYNKLPDDRTPDQGWKLHLSATILNAHEVLKRVAPFLISKGVQFKGPRSLEDIARINGGTEYPFSQVGKVFTVYPHNEKEAVRLASKLHDLTFGLDAPVVPFDNRYQPSSNVYYRYGAFKGIETTAADGSKVYLIKDNTGEFIPDLYLPGRAVPDWVNDPFRHDLLPSRQADNPLSQMLRVIRSLTQRGKGGVYQAVDLSGPSPRLCLLKEGRRAGEVNWEGHDGCWRVRQEERALRILRSRGVDVPLVHYSFEIGGNYYLVTEYIEGECLHSFLMRQEKRLSLARVLELSISLAEFISHVHKVGWVWGDCKPANLIITKSKHLRPLDFEGAHPLNKPYQSAWSTPGYSPRKHCDGNAKDLYALGVVIYFLLIGRMPGEDKSALDLSRRRRNLPFQLCEIVSDLLNFESQEQHDAGSIYRRLMTLHRTWGKAKPACST